MQYYKRKIITCNRLNHPSTFFRINKIKNNFENYFYYIEEIYSIYRNKLSYSGQKELIIPKKDIIELSFWIFIKLKNKKYIIRNRSNCFVRITKYNTFICDDNSLEKATEFDIIKIYEEVKEDAKTNNIIEKEPIDVLIKYIDLRDHDLKRKKIHQIGKDYDNEELRYSIRSILKNIPWIRKIFILMPNKKVRYFKDLNLIKKKIVYIKDSKILGYDSSNINAFLFRYWKLKKFGISDNFIVMDDDCFIGKPLKKKDFFYVRNGTVVPVIITSNFKKIDRNSSEINYHIYKNLASKKKEKQNSEAFNYSLYLTYIFILNIFTKTKNESLYIPKFTHNAIPVNVEELKEIYYLVYNSEYKSATLDSLYREIGYVQFQQFVLSYTFIKYDKKVKDIRYNFIKINNTISANFNYSLFCINTADYNYSYLNFYTAKISMEYLFPIPTPYEIIDFSLPNISFNVIKSMEETISKYERIIKQFNKIKQLIKFIILNALFFLIKVYNNNNNYYYQKYEILNE